MSYLEQQFEAMVRSMYGDQVLHAQQREDMRDSFFSGAVVALGFPETWRLRKETERYQRELQRRADEMS